jgi:hypothetical protein
MSKVIFSVLKALRQAVKEGLYTKGELLDTVLPDLKRQYE